eukprot:1940542-Rhodomonas_salina.1
MVSGTARCCWQEESASGVQGAAHLQDAVCEARQVPRVPFHHHVQRLRRRLQRIPLRPTPFPAVPLHCARSRL